MADAAGTGLRNEHQALRGKDIDPAAGTRRREGLELAGRRLAEIEHCRVSRAEKQAIARAGERSATVARPFQIPIHLHVQRAKPPASGQPVNRRLGDQPVAKDHRVMHLLPVRKRAG